jgi:hypothetical protein
MPCGIRLRQSFRPDAYKKSALAISPAVLTSINVTAHSQSSVVANPVVDGAAHPGTALLDSAGIFAGVPTPNVAPVHPETALLDSLGIFAGEPTGSPTITGDSQGIASTATLK